MKKTVDLQFLRSYYRVNKDLTETEKGFQLHDDESGLSFILPKEVYLMQDGDIFDPMHKYLDAEGEVRAWMNSMPAGYAKGAEIRYMFGRYEKDARAFYLLSDLEAWENEVSDLYIELFWDEYESEQRSRWSYMAEHLAVVDLQTKDFWATSTPYKTQLRRYMVVSLDNPILSQVATERHKQLLATVSKADTVLHIHMAHQEEYKAKFWEYAAQLDTNKRKATFEDEWMEVRCKLNPFESLVRKYRFDEVGERMLLNSFPFLKK